MTTFIAMINTILLGITMEIFASHKFHTFINFINNSFKSYYFPSQANELTTLIGHSDRVLGVAMATNGQVVTTSMDCTVKVWKPQVRKNLSVIYFIYLYIYLSISIYPFTLQCISFLYLFFSIHLHIYLPFYTHVYLSLYLSIYFFINLSFCSKTFNVYPFLFLSFFFLSFFSSLLPPFSLSLCLSSHMCSLTH